uniref:Uncharacterized protein n=1 Tax=Nelumbo nucifera TaxID=4432 RepID=A0A822YW42_NELNU|nr:TPA_asm: hypothetical protein HUJ06_008945 [Nelumbo nucifera]
MSINITSEVSKACFLGFQTVDLNRPSQFDNPITTFQKREMGISLQTPPALHKRSILAEVITDQHYLDGEKQ